MKKARIFIVDDNTWEEHNMVGIAAINDPLITHPSNRNANTARQSAIAEISGIRPGDLIFFNRMVSEKHPPEILGVYEATSNAYYDPSPLFPRAKYIDKKHPFRVEFRCLHHFEKSINIDEIWALKEKGLIWTLQQTRGDAVGVHACIGITKLEANIILKLLKANNIVEQKPINYLENRKRVGLNNILKKPLPLDFECDREGVLHYESVLKALLLEDFAKNKHKKIFGDYDDFIPNVPTGARKEIDILLLKYNGRDILWLQILELKHDKFTMKELQRLIDYEKWLIRIIKSENPFQVHPVAVASTFQDEVKHFAKEREKYGEKSIRLIKYYFDKKEKSIKLEEVL